MYCCNSEKSDQALGRFTRFFFYVILAAIGGFLLCSAPELKRYIKISSM